MMIQHLQVFLAGMHHNNDLRVCQERDEWLPVFDGQRVDQKYLAARRNLIQTRNRIEGIRAYELGIKSHTVVPARNGICQFLVCFNPKN